MALTSISSIFPRAPLAHAFPKACELRYIVTHNKSIQDLCNQNGFKPKVAFDNIVPIFREHMLPTQRWGFAVGITMGLTQKGISTLCKSAILHDVGKALIPKAILDKPGVLNPKERAIMDLHALLGYQTLKGMNGISDDVLDAVKNHQLKLDGNIKPNFITQILTVADIFTALLTQRSYKPKMSLLDALMVLDREVELGQLNQQVVECLKTLV